MLSDAKIRTRDTVMLRCLERKIDDTDYNDESGRYGQN
jgi:hypothetical protein